MKSPKSLILLLILSMIVTACGSEATPTQAPTQAPPAEVVELRMMWYNDGVEGEVMRDLLDRFEAANPDIRVVMDTVAYADLHTILQGQVETGTGPDLARVTDVNRFKQYYLDMRPYMTDPDGWAANWPEAVLNSLRVPGDTKGLHGFPTQFTVTGPFINRTLFEQAGVPVPSDTSDKVTWETWVEAAKKVAAATGTPYAVAIDRTGHRFWGPSLSRCATYITEDGFKIDTPGFRSTAQMISDVAVERFPLAPDRRHQIGAVHFAGRVECLSGRAQRAVAIHSGDDGAHVVAHQRSIRLPAGIHHHRHRHDRHEVTLAERVV